MANLEIFEVKICRINSSMRLDILTLYAVTVAGTTHLRPSKISGHIWTNRHTIMEVRVTSLDVIQYLNKLPNLCVTGTCICKNVVNILVRKRQHRPVKTVIG